MFVGVATPRARLALHLRRFGEDVVLCTHGPAELDEAMLTALAAHGAGVRQEPISRASIPTPLAAVIVAAASGTVPGAPSTRIC